MTKPAIFAIKRHESCPECGAELVIRSGRYGAFLGCSAYPECQYHRPLKAQIDGHIIKELPELSCPKCQAVQVLRQGRYGMFISCRHYPACDHTEVIDKPDETAINCPQCTQGQLLQRKSRYGKLFYACNRYPECQFSLNTKPVTGECAYCHYPLLTEQRSSKGTKLCCASKICRKPVLVE
ncbi:type I DNA topoisomerase [Serratia microhaemolytica]|uniref:DNA topoisomerase family protein n=1 Tax=Serratia microhaemolytica TaxID=2675110 RepID=UPI000FDDE9F7|nr:type I DNA topoisomerase [Serratia microhaemolytica]